MSSPADYYDLERIRPEVLKVLNRINDMGPNFADRAFSIDNDASFPVENYKDLASEGFMTLTVPEEFGGMDFNLGEYAMVGAEIAKKLLEKSISFVVFDRGGYVFHGRVQALAEGAREAGLKF